MRALVLSAHIFSCFEHSNLKGLSIDRLWDHAIGTGMIARMILRLEKAEATDAEDAYTAGMLHDLGKLMLANSLPKQFQRAITVAAERKMPLHEVELEIFGATHAGVAAYLLGLWGLPASIVEAVAFHHTPALSDMRSLGPLAAVHVANALEHELKSNTGRRPGALDFDYLSTVGVLNRLAVWRAEAAPLLRSGTA